MTRTLEAALVFSDSVAASETLAALGQQGQFSVAEVRNQKQKVIATGAMTRRILLTKSAVSSATGYSRNR